MLSRPQAGRALQWRLGLKSAQVSVFEDVFLCHECRVGCDPGQDMVDQLSSYLFDAVWRLIACGHLDKFDDMIGFHIMYVRRVVKGKTAGTAHGDGVSAGVHRLQNPLGGNPGSSVRAPRS